MQKAGIDLSVLIIFFARPNTLSEVFAQVKKARPSRLFLACDGARENRADDAENIEACKKIVEDIDWECEVYTRYSEENLGCGRGPSSAISWAFEHVDKLLILEDDCVANPTLFPYMKELLDRYEHDERIGLISGFNHFKTWETHGNSYCFTKCGATLGWGTWKRVWEKYDYTLQDIDEPGLQDLLEKEIINRRAGKARYRAWRSAAKETREKKVNYWDIQFGFIKYAQSYLCIVPRANLIYNNGVGAGSTHTENIRQKKWKQGDILFMPTEDMQFPLQHPKYVVCDRTYDERYFKKMAYPHPIIRLFRKLKRRIFKR